MKDKAFYEKKIQAMKDQNPFISTTEIAYHLVLNDILLGELPENQKINQEDLVALFSMSRTPIRDALIKLCNDGYIEKNGRSGYKVYTIHLKDYVDFFEFRLLLETQAAYLAARNITDEQLAQLKENLAIYDKAIAAKDTEKLVFLDNDFHNIIIQASDNAYIIDVFNTYKKKKLFLAKKLILLQNLRNMKNKHAAIYQALCNSDENEARALMQSHLSFYLKNLYLIM